MDELRQRRLDRRHESQLALFNCVCRDHRRKPTQQRDGDPARNVLLALDRWLEQLPDHRLRNYFNHWNADGRLGLHDRLLRLSELVEHWRGRFYPSTHQHEYEYTDRPNR